MVIGVCFDVLIAVEPAKRNVQKLWTVSTAAENETFKVVFDLP